MIFVDSFVSSVKRAEIARKDKPNIGKQKPLAQRTKGFVYHQ